MKQKRRITEKRKECSRRAAKCRRDKESVVFADLLRLLPVDKMHVEIDKSSIIRLTLSYLKLQSLLRSMKENDHRLMSTKSKSFPDTNASPHMKALDGFLMIISRVGEIMYVSENVNHYLGLFQVEMIGQNVYDFLHPCDHNEMKTVLIKGKCDRNVNTANGFSFIARMKHLRSKKCQNVNAAHKALQFSGRMSFGEIPALYTEGSKKNYLIVVCSPICGLDSVEVPLGSHMFMSRHNVAMDFTHCDDSVYDLLGYEPTELIGQSIYNYHHVIDATEVIKSYKDLFEKGQTIVSSYRFLAKMGGHAWVETYATVVNEPPMNNPTAVVCIHDVISCIENPTVVLSSVQDVASSLLLPAPYVKAEDAAFEETLESLLHLDDNSLLQFICGETPSLPISVANDDDFMPQTGGISLDPMPQTGGIFLDPMPLTFGIEDEGVICQEPLSVIDNEVCLNDNSLYNDVLLDDLCSVPDPMMSSQINQEIGRMNDGSTASALDIDVSMRAPYIPALSDHELFSAHQFVDPVSEAFCDSAPSLMFGITESSFASCPEPECSEDQETLRDKIPLDVLRAMASQLNDVSFIGDVEQNEASAKLEQTVETNRLENGPPYMGHGDNLGLVSSSASYFQSPASAQGYPLASPSYLENSKESKKNSVLRSLLLFGEDRTEQTKWDSRSATRVTPLHIPVFNGNGVTSLKDQSAEQHSQVKLPNKRIKLVYHPPVVSAPKLVYVLSNCREQNSSK